MPLLTLFTAPKPFTDPHIDTIQRNALKSWLSLGDQAEVLVIGDEPGLAEAAAEAGVRQLAGVKRNARGTPLISSIFSLARQHSRSPYLCYANADILFLPDLLETTRAVSHERSPFVLVGQRWDLEVREELDFSSGWEAEIARKVRDHGRLHPPAGSDYFIFPIDAYSDIPDFAVGRAGWDNWMISHAVKEGWAVIDGTRAVTAIHQNHDYSHLPGGTPHYDHEESEINRALAGGKANMYLVTDAGLRLVDGRLEPVQRGFTGWVRRAELWLTPAQVQPSGVRWFLARRLRRLRRRLSHSGVR